jgi:propanol-preferring alcohol dehydrogenase
MLVVSPSWTVGVEHLGVIMRAAVVTSFDAPLEIRELPIPTPGTNQVRVRLETSGLCHTDIHAAHGDWPVKPSPPFIPGHEGVGVVTELGVGARNDLLGQRVAIPWLGSACGHCEYCISGWETLCQSQQNSGYSIDGTYAEYAVANADYVVVVPDAVSSFDAAPLTCAGVTAYKALKVSHAGPSDLVAIFGIGGLGHLAVQYAKIAGATVVGVDLEEDKLALARKLGADHTVNGSVSDPVEQIQRLGGADAALSFAVSPRAMRQAFDSLRPGGRLVLVAMPKDNELSLPIFETVLKGITVIGSIVGTRLDLAEVFELHAAGRTTVIAESRKLEDVNACMDEVLDGKVSGRLVFEY